MGRLTTIKAKTAQPGRHGDGEGLYLLVNAAPVGERATASTHLAQRK